MISFHILTNKYSVFVNGPNFTIIVMKIPFFKQLIANKGGLSMFCWFNRNACDRPVLFAYLKDLLEIVYRNFWNCLDRYSYN